MQPERSGAGSGDADRESRRPDSVRRLAVLGFSVLALAHVPVASAHGGTAVSGVSPVHGLVLALVGVCLLGGSILCKRRDRVPPSTALSGAFLGIAVITLGAVLFEGLSPDRTYAASSMPFPRSWYEPPSLGVGLSITVLSLAVGWLRWPTRPRYTFPGMSMGLWISYPYLIPGSASETHPLGYGIVLVALSYG